MSFPRTTEVSKHLARKSGRQPNSAVKPTAVAKSLTNEDMDLLAEHGPAGMVSKLNTGQPGSGE
jgi:cytochrome c553